MSRKLLLGTFLGLAVIFGLAYGTSHTSVLATETETMPPTPPIMISALADNYQVSLVWQTGQPGTFALKFYDIFRKSSGGDFTQIAEVSGDTTSYMDTSGQLGDVYKIASLDDQDPANVSINSDEITATAPKADAPSATLASLVPIPADPQPVLVELPPNVKPQDVIISSVGQLNNQEPKTPVNPKDGLDNSEINQLEKQGDVRPVQLQYVVATKNQDLIKPVLDRYTQEKTTIYQHYSSLSKDQQTTTKQNCEQQLRTLETTLVMVPDAYQAPLLIAIAQCYLIQQKP